MSRGPPGTARSASRSRRSTRAGRSCGSAAVAASRPPRSARPPRRERARPRRRAGGRPRRRTSSSRCRSGTGGRSSKGRRSPRRQHLPLAARRAQDRSPRRPHPGRPPRAMRRDGRRAGSRKSALEGIPPRRPAVGCEHVLDRQLEERAQSSTICSRVTPSSSHSTGTPRPRPKSTSVSPATIARRSSTQSTRSFGSHPGEDVDPDRQPVADRVEVRLTDVAGDQPGQIGTALAGRGHEHRRAVPLDQAASVALVPRVRQHDHRLALGRELLELVRHRKRVEEEQMLAVVDRVRRDDRVVPRHTRLPVRVRRLPVPQARLQLAHAAMLTTGTSRQRVDFRRSTSRSMSASVSGRSKYAR